MTKNELVQKFPDSCAEIATEGYEKGFLVGLREGKALARDFHKDRQVTQRKPAFMCCFDDFVSACLSLDDSARCGAMDAYHRFAFWFRETVGGDVPSVTMFGRRMGMRFKRTKHIGNNVYHGVRLKD